MNILHLVHQYRPHYVGGTEIYTEKLARHQAAAGDRVAVFVPTPDLAAAPHHALEDGVHVWRVPLGARGRGRVFLATYGEPALGRALAPLLDAVDIVHIQHLMGLPLDLVAQIQAAGIPYVITLHDYWFACANAQLITNYDGRICGGPDAAFHNCGRCAVARAGGGDRPTAGAAIAPLLAGRARRLRAVFDGAAAVIAVSDFVRQTIAALGFDGPQLVTRPTGILTAAELAMARRPRPPAAADRGLHVVYVGSLAWQKGVHVLVEAFNRLPTTARLSIAGATDSFPTYVTDLRARIAHPGVTLLGRVPHAALWELLATADVAVVPSLWYEGSPLTIDELHAAGVPVVASAIGALPEKVRDGVDGLLFAPGDVAALAAVLRRLNDTPALLAALRAGAQPVRTLADHAAAVGALYAHARLMRG